MSDRILRINSEIQKAISEIILHEVKNPMVTGIISVTKVDTTQDLEIAKVYVSIFTTMDKMEVFNQIKHSAGFIRGELSRRVALRKTPYLEFILDESAEYGQQIDKKINSINKERELLGRHQETDNK